MSLKNSVERLEECPRYSVGNSKLPNNSIKTELCQSKKPVLNAEAAKLNLTASKWVVEAVERAGKRGCGDSSAWNWGQ